MESIIQFSNRHREILRGVLHSPEFPGPTKQKHLVIFPNGGVMGGEGDYRAHLSIARHLTANGFYVLRFSPSGFGASDGDIPDCRQKNLYNQIENGLIVGDIKAAVRYAKSVDRFSSITLSGVCGGAISSFLAAADIPEVEYIVPIGVPVILDNDESDYSKRYIVLEKGLVFKTYLDKMFSPKAWVRLLLNKSDVATIKAAIFALFRKKSSYMGSGNEKDKFSSNPLFFDAIKKILRKKKKILFVFGDNDAFWWEFQNLFLKTHYQDAQELPFDIYVASRANHMLSLPEMQFDVAQATLSWMEKHLKNQ